MQDSRCDSDIDCTHRKLKILSECRDFFSQIFINFFELRAVFRTFQTSNSGYNFFSRNFEKSQKLKIDNDLFINATALRAPPAVTRLTVHRRLQVPGRMPFGLICRLQNLLPGNRTEAIS